MSSMAKQAKPHVARTFAPIHFEDLDPHRFEDLVRELIYDFRDWLTIEATGRAGGDEGFDVRAFEKVPSAAEPADDEGEAEGHPMDGRLWMIQGKREKTITPADIKAILADVDESNPPHGYILAASTTFSKKSYDAFRDILREKGVMEFYLWGSGELEGMLHLPKNDRILFTFFGVSLVSRRRSRTTEVRTVVTIKNKLFKTLGEPGNDFSQPVLLRDINDTHYPFRSKYADFRENPRWVEREAFRHHPVGFWVHMRKFFAYVDRERKEWDFSDAVNLLYKRVEIDEEREQNRRSFPSVKTMYDFFPRSKKGDFHIDGLIKYDEVFLVDPEGDGYYKFPHIYLDFPQQQKPIYAGQHDFLSVGQQHIELTDEWKRTRVFKGAPLESDAGLVVLNDKCIVLDKETFKAHFEFKGDAETLYAADDRYDYLKARNVVPIEGAHEGQTHYLKVTHVQKGTLEDYLRHHPRRWEASRFAARQIGREVSDTETLTMVEVDRAYPRDWESQ